MSRAPWWRQSLAVAPLLPAPHVHEAEEHGHVRWTVHQHLSPHALVPDAGLAGHVEDDDEPILTRTTIFTVPAHHHGITAPPATSWRSSSLRRSASSTAVPRSSNR